MGRLIGYARVSTPDQSLDLQLDELTAAGCKKIFSDKISGVRAMRPGLDQCLETVRAGDTLIVWRLDRLGRSMPHLVSVVTELRERNIGFKSLKDGVIDTTTASGELIFNIFDALAQFDRELIRERARAGLKAARARGKSGGRKPVSKDDPRVIAAKKMHADISISISQICKTLKISKATLYRWIKM
jgi:DNA invertase Pin-like site-specific DNA recombinase